MEPTDPKFREDIHLKPVEVLDPELQKRLDDYVAAPFLHHTIEEYYDPLRKAWYKRQL